ncbi:MAG TPA: hypothetical protein ACFYEM_06135, partial [Candidatus Hypogeohydataceae bacterium YC40]
KQTEGWSGAEIELLCRRATMITIRNLIEKKGEEASPLELHINSGDFKQALEEMKTHRNT